MNEVDTSVDGQRTLYEKVHADSRAYQHPQNGGANHGRAHIDAFCQLARPPGIVLELGAGNGWACEQFRSRGLNVIAMDIAANAECHKRIPSLRHCAWEVWPHEARADWFFSCDFFEHLPPERVPEVFQQIVENIRYGGYMQVCLVEDVSGPKLVGHPLHLTVEGPGWWTTLAGYYFKHVRILQDNAGHITLFMRRELEVHFTEE